VIYFLEGSRLPHPIFLVMALRDPEGNENEISFMLTRLIGDIGGFHRDTEAVPER